MTRSDYTLLQETFKTKLDLVTAKRNNLPQM